MTHDHVPKWFFKKTHKLFKKWKKIRESNGLNDNEKKKIQLEIFKDMIEDATVEEKELWIIYVESCEDYVKLYDQIERDLIKKGVKASHKKIIKVLDEKLYGIDTTKLKLIRK